MQVAGMEAKADLAAGLAEYVFLFANGPSSGKAPLIWLEPRRRLIGRHAIHISGARGEIFAAAVAQISFRRIHVGLVSGGEGALRVRVNDPARHVLVTRLLEQSLDHALGFVVFAFTKMVGADAAFCVHEIVRRPVLILEGLPDG